MAEIYEAHIDYVWCSLRRLGVLPADLEDLAHDVFVVVHRRIGDFDRSRPIQPWLFGICMRVARDHRRLARHRREVLSDGEVESPSEATGPLEELAARQAQQLVAEALAGLDFDQRAVFIMHEVNGHSMPEISEVIDAPLNTLYSRLRAARSKFERLVRRGSVLRGES